MRECKDRLCILPCWIAAYWLAFLQETSHRFKARSGLKLIDFPDDYNAIMQLTFTNREQIQLGPTFKIDGSSTNLEFQSLGESKQKAEDVAFAGFARLRFGSPSPECVLGEE